MAYSRILSRLLNTPLAISQDKLDIITANVSLKLLAGESIPSLDADVSSKSISLATESTPTIGVIPVFDSLVARNGAGDSGSTSYASISSAIDSAIADKVDTIVFNIGSPGGEVEGLFELASKINSLPSLGIRTISVATGNMASAAYVLGAAAQEVYATEASIVGSIGVIMTMVNTMAADKKNGIEYTILRSKDEKALGNPHEPMSKKAMTDAKGMLAKLDTIMNETVNSFRPNLSIEKIVSMKGNTVLGKEAADIGLTDGIVSSLQEVISSISTKNSIKSLKQGANMATTTSADAEIAALKAQLAEATQQLAATTANAAKAEQERFNAILNTANTLGIPNASSVAQKYFAAGMTAQDATTQMTILKESIQLANPSPSIDALQGSHTPNVTGLYEPEKSYADLISDRIGARAKVQFNCAEDASELEAADALLELFK